MSAAVDDRDDDVPVVLPGLRFGRGHRLLGLIKPYRRAIVTNTFMNGGLRRNDTFAAGKLHSEPPSHHSITSSARPSSGRGTVSPSALAVLRLITSVYFSDCWIGKSPGFVPLRMRST